MLQSNCELRFIILLSDLNYWELKLNKRFKITQYFLSFLLLIKINSCLVELILFDEASIGLLWSMLFHLKNDMLADVSSKVRVALLFFYWFIDNVVLVFRKDGSLKFIYIIGILMTSQKKNSYPVWKIDATLWTLSGLKWFSTLDCQNGYWQVETHREDRKNTAFSRSSELYQSTVMPTGLSDGSATFIEN